MSQFITRGGLAQSSAQVAPVSLGQFGLPNILQMLLQPQKPPKSLLDDEEDETPLNASDQDPFAILSGKNRFGEGGNGGQEFDVFKRFREMM